MQPKYFFLSFFPLTCLWGRGKRIDDHMSQNSNKLQTKLAFEFC